LSSGTFAAKTGCTTEKKKKPRKNRGFSLIYPFKVLENGDVAQK
jgi:hypothetical protein